jgi:hypothetical protein
MLSGLLLAVGALFLAYPSVAADERGEKRNNPEANAGPRDGEHGAKPGPKDGEGARKAGPRDGEGGPRPEAKKDAPGGVPAAAKNQKEAKIFVTYDKDKDGTVSDEEIVAMMEGKQNSRGKREVRKAVDRADKDNDGVLGFNEFVWWLKIGRADERARNR